MLPLMVLLGTIAGAWYLLIVRPQKDLQTRHGRLVERLQVGDHVLTVGGIYGRVVALDGLSVVLELAPGLTSRIATDGLARIVHGAEAALPTHQTDGTPHAAPTPRHATDDHMHQHPESRHAPATHPHDEALQVALPPQPFATAPTGHVTAHAPDRIAAHQAPVATVFRAHVLPALPTFEPRPWGDSAPVAHTHAPQQSGSYAPPRVGYPQPAAHPQIGAYPPAPPMPHMPVHAPFAASTTSPPQVQQPFSQPQQQRPGQYGAAQLPPVHYAVPQVALHAPAMPGHATQLPVQQTGAEHVTHPAQAADPAAARRTSRAPDGMGSSLRLDDPSIRDTMNRARDERAGLADEYRKLTAPLVQVDDPGIVPGTAALHQHHAAPPAPQLIGSSDPSSIPLFATSGAAGVHAIAHYPSPARIPLDPMSQATVPRPNVTVDGTRVDAAHADAFQRRTPFAPTEPANFANADAPAPERVHAHADTHADTHAHA